MAGFPRDKAPRDVDSLEGYMHESVTSQGGVSQMRNVANRGFRWTERWPIIVAGEPEIEKLVTFIRANAQRGSSFTVKHITTPGSGKPPNGTGTAGIQPASADQTGSTLDTTGWPASTTGVVRAGDVIKIEGFDHVHLITADADSDGSGNATLPIWPSIYVGESPSVSAVITTTDVELTAKIDDYSVPTAPPGDLMNGLSVTFRELPKASG